MKNRSLYSLIAMFGVFLFTGASAEAQTVTGSGAAGTIPRWTGTTTIGNSSIKADSIGQVAKGGFAGISEGNVSVTGTLSKGGGSFKIDHPLDPENKYLYHSFVESPDMKNIYDGNIITNDDGEAVVEMPEYFEALNSDFRYQLTVLGTFAQAIVAKKIKDNRFVTRTSAPNVEVSWQVTGVRQDAFANKPRIPVEEAKPETERGYYLHPEAFDKPSERGVGWARNSDLMQHLNSGPSGTDKRTTTTGRSR